MRGGGPISIVVTESRKNGELLELDYEMFGGPEGSYNKTVEGTTTIRVGADGYKYVSNVCVRQ